MPCATRLTWDRKREANDKLGLTARGNKKKERIVQSPDHVNGVVTEYWKSGFKPVGQSTANSKGGDQEIAVQKTGIA
jgi:hypothetical protein